MDLKGFAGHSRLCRMSVRELEEVAALCRKRIIDKVSSNGGHLASNLGCVELTIALHKVFDPARTPIIFDVGHQCYTHKLLTGRDESFEKLREKGGCSGFPHPAESPLDPAVGGHAGNALSVALGIGAARELENDPEKVIAVVGDGALGNGISFEALNSAGRGGKNLILILNDNKMSISPAVGAVSGQLSKLISGRFYNRSRRFFRHFILFSPRLFRLFRRLDDWLKAVLLPPGAIFQSFGFRFFGPVDGHSLPELITMLERVKDLEGPLMLHVVTKKGKGAAYAENAPVTYHGVGKFEPESGRMSASSGGFSETLGRWMCRKGEKDDRLIGVSAAMIPGVGMTPFAEKFPGRCFDVGIAEEHAAVFSAGMAIGGKRPVCALYATFAQRALDCIYHDTVLGKVPVIFVFDRAGAVPDGPTHHGIYDLGFLRSLPGLTVMMPRSSAELEMMLEFAYGLEAPCVIRYPRGGDCEKALPAPEKVQMGKAQILREFPEGPVLWALGAECGTAEAAADILKSEGINCTLINARFAAPFDSETALRFSNRLQAVIEDHASGGLGSALCECCASGSQGRILTFNWGGAPVGHGNVAALRREHGLDPENIARRIMEHCKANQ
ncbi:MAG: 1-deoxy-D-xylulose-5-phosphate synthase [Lentisphaeria bacterium]|nr:1-deoxy-D-xylulose-5-phosphate synthase [Lentisphaeria bacterium]